MPWGNSRQTRNKLYEADYNRAFDTHQQSPTSREFEVNGPNSAEAAPQNLNTEGGYRNPLNRTFDPDDISHTVGPRDVQTGNAPSGGYTTLPGMGFASGLNGYEFPDNRRSLAYRPSDWEANQVQIDFLRDAELRKRRAETTKEDLSALESEVRLGSVDRSAKASYSPYSKTWGEGGRMTSGTNPNKFRLWREWGTSDGERRDAGARYLNGEHYSMATHNSLNPYGPSTDGMDPVRKSRNTYRLDPQPWDSGLNDAPTNTQTYADNVPSLNSVSDTTGLGRSYRL